MKITDKIRRAIFKVGAEGASYFENCIWVLLGLAVIGIPITIALLQSVWKGLVVILITAAVLFVGSLIYVGIADAILAEWPFEISDEEKEFEENYKPRIPLD